MAQYILKFNVRLNLQQLMNVDRFQKQNQPTLIAVAADRYFKYLRNRYISTSAGRGKVPPLAESTIERKERRGIADSPHWILREYDVLLSALGVRTINKTTYVGFVRDRKHPRGKSVFQLVRMHGRGEGRLPVRIMIGLPPKSTEKKMVQDVRDAYNKIIRKNRTK